jgi:hypothetical protein
LSVLPSEAPAVAPVLVAALLLAANTHLAPLGLPHPTAAQVGDATGGGRTQAYALAKRILAFLPALLRPPGRPPTPSPPPIDTGAITLEVLSFLRAHPGAAITAGTRHTYSDGFRGFILDLFPRHPDLNRFRFAEAVGVPFETLKDWLDKPRPVAAPKEPITDDATDDVTDDVTDARIAAIIEAYRRWDGPFSAFCAFVRSELRIPYGDTLIGDILAVRSGRRRKRRQGRSADEKATRNALVRFFSGAQWFQDGSPIAITLNERRFLFNWELAVDGWSAALVGASLRPEEDAVAVVSAFEDGVATTGEKPLALNTDNRAANHAPEVAAALGDDTLHIRTTLGRPQNDAPIEGAFGLFQQTAPPLVIRGDTEEELARAALAVILTVYCRATNHRPRTDRKGRTRVQLYRGERPTDVQIAAAKVQLEERRRRQELSFYTRQARLDPVVRALLEEAFTTLNFEDPTGNLKDAIARYPHDAVLAGIATFEGKRDAGTLKSDAGPRYLLGIVRNIAERDEGLAVARRLWERRLAARDGALRRLLANRDATTGTPEARLGCFVDRALDDDGPLTRDFWLAAAGDVVLAEPPAQHRALYDLAARRVHATFRVDLLERHAAVRVLAERILVA